MYIETEEAKTYFSIPSHQGWKLNRKLQFCPRLSICSGLFGGPNPAYLEVRNGLGALSLCLSQSMVFTWATRNEDMAADVPRSVVTSAREPLFKLWRHNFTNTIKCRGKLSHVAHTYLLRNEATSMMNGFKFSGNEVFRICIVLWVGKLCCSLQLFSFYIYQRQVLGCLFC